MVDAGSSDFGVGGVGSSVFGSVAAGSSDFGAGVAGSSAFGAGVAGSSTFGAGTAGSSDFGVAPAAGSSTFGVVPAAGSSAFGAGVAGSSTFGAGVVDSSAFGAVVSVFGAEVSGCSVVSTFEEVSSVTELDDSEFPDSFVASADGVLEGSAVVSDLPVSPVGCVVELDSPDVTGDDVESLGFGAVESPVGVVDGAPDSSE